MTVPPGGWSGTWSPGAPRSASARGWRRSWPGRGGACLGKSLWGARVCPGLGGASGEPGGEGVRGPGGQGRGSREPGPLATRRAEIPSPGAWRRRSRGGAGRGLEGPGRGLGRPSRCLPFTPARWCWRWLPRNPARTGPAPAPVKAEAAAGSGPGPWEPPAARVMRTEAEAAGPPLEPGQCSSRAQLSLRGTGGDPALARGRVRPRDLGPTAAAARAVEL